MLPTVVETPGESMADIEQGPSIIISNHAQAHLNISMPTKQRDEVAIIDVDALAYKDISEQPKMSVRVCEGYTMTFLDGHWAITTYHIPLCSP